MAPQTNGSALQSASPVLASAYAVLPYSEDVTLNPAGLDAFAKALVNDKEAQAHLQARSTWHTEPLHPIPVQHTPQFIADWIFLVSLLNFSFWSQEPDDRRYAVRWKVGMDGKEGTNATSEPQETDWTGYWSLPAAINRALDEDIPITSPEFWCSASDQELRHVFRTASPPDREEMPLLDTRLNLMREAGAILSKDYHGSFFHLLETFKLENIDALKLVQKVVEVFPMFRDEAQHPQAGHVYLWKRPQILVAELWAAYESTRDQHEKTFPRITGISGLTMFADYRVPQILNYLHLITYSDGLQTRLENKEDLASGSEDEVCLRAMSIACVEELRRRVVSLLIEQGRRAESEQLNAVILDFWLWNRAKQLESKGEPMLECHRTRSIWY